MIRMMMMRCVGDCIEAQRGIQKPAAPDGLMGTKTEDDVAARVCEAFLFPGKPWQSLLCCALTDKRGPTIFQDFVWGDLQLSFAVDVTSLRVTTG